MATASSSASTTATKRTTSSTTAIPAAKPTTKVHSLAIIADRAQLIGPHTITIDSHTILHPYCKLSASSGNITIGVNCIIAEKALVGSSDSSSPSRPGEEETGGEDCIVAEGVSIESAAQVSGKRIGEWSTIGVGATVAKGAVVGKWCKIGPLCEVGEDEVLEDFTVVYGYGARRIDTTLRDHEEVREARMKGRRKEVELLAELIPDAGAKWRG